MGELSPELSHRMDQERDPEIRAALRQIELTEPSGELHGGVLTVNLAPNCYIRADVYEHQALVDMVSVPAELQGNGIGERLLKTLSASLADRGVTSLDGNFRSKGGLKLRAKVFGEDNIEFSSFFDGEPLNLTYGQALASLGDEIGQAGANNWLSGVTDLTRVDMRDWERAQITQGE